MTTDEYQAECRTLLAVTNEAAWARRTLDGCDRLDEVSAAEARCQEVAAAFRELLALGTAADGPASGPWVLRPIP